MRNCTWIVGLACAGASLVYGQQSSIAGPSSGFVFDPGARALRPIRGLPGAALIGDPVAFGFDLASANVSPGLNSALVVSPQTGLHLFRIVNGTPVEFTMDGLRAPEHIVFSPMGTAAALYAAGSVQVLKGLPDAPVIAATLALSPNRATQVSAAGLNPRGGKMRRVTDLPLAISDDGAYLLVVSGGAFRLIGTAGDNLKLMDAAGGAWAAFAPGSHDAAVLDDAAGLVLFRDVRGASVPQILASPDSRIASPVGLAFSPDGRKLLVASAAARGVAAFDTTSGDSSVVACDCTPSGLIPMGRLFRLNEMGAEPLWLLDAAASEARMFFVPARGAEF